MNTKIRIKDTKEFDYILKNGLHKKNNFFIIYYIDKKKDNSRFGITFSKKFGKAYMRNRYKRKLREIIRINQNKFKNNYDYIIIMRKECGTLDYQQMEKSIMELI